MSGVFQNIDPPPPHHPASVYPPDFGAGVRTRTRWVERGWGVNSSEDARHCSVLRIYKYFVLQMIERHSSFQSELRCQYTVTKDLQFRWR
jgi:hypothetical protein